MCLSKEVEADLLSDLREISDLSQIRQGSQETKAGFHPGLLDSIEVLAKAEEDFKPAQM